MSEQNRLDKAVSDNFSTLNHSSQMSNTVTNKIKYYPQLFSFGPEIPWKRKEPHFYMLSTNMLILARVY